MPPLKIILYPHYVFTNKNNILISSKYTTFSTLAPFPNCATHNNNNNNNRNDPKMAPKEEAIATKEETIPITDRPLPAHPLAFLIPVDTEETFEDFERKTLQEWGYDADNLEAAYGPPPYRWRDNLCRTWTEATAQTIAKETTPFRLAIFKEGIKPFLRPDDSNPRDGILGRQIAKAAFLKDHPEVLDIEIEPIILVGQNRTGTTLLHRLLSLDDARLSPKGWDLTFPLGLTEYPEGQDDEKEAQKRTEQLQQAFPEIKHHHDLDFTKPEECLFAMNDDLEFGHCINTPEQPTHRVLDSSEMKPVYESYKQTLQILSYRKNPNSRRASWVLKCPSHLPHLKLLKNLFPKARFVWTHRSMDKVIASFCALSQVFATSSLPALTPATMGRHMMNYYTEMVSKGMAQRESLDKDEHGNNANLFVDVAFNDLVSDPIGQVRCIYDQLGLEWSETFENSMKAYLEEDAKEREALNKERGENYRKPSLEDYAIEPDVVQSTFSAYHEKYVK